jgi:hypothetical protein
MTEKSGVCPEVILRLRGGGEFFCMNLSLLLGGCAGVLCFCVIYGEFNCVRGRQQWGRLFLVPLWGALLYLAKIPLEIILKMLGLFVLLVVFKMVVRCGSVHS